MKRTDEFAEVEPATSSYSPTPSVRRVADDLRRLGPLVYRHEAGAAAAMFVAAELLCDFADERDRGARETNPAAAVVKRPAKARPAAATAPERKRAARGLPSCSAGGRHAWGLDGWCTKCHAVHFEGKVQEMIPGSADREAAAT